MMEVQNTRLNLGFFSFYDDSCERLWVYNIFIIPTCCRVFYIWRGNLNMK
jgi:hypothetical protein